MQKKTQGKLVVLEGSDGSGKGTQLHLLLDFLKNHHINHASLDFPQYYKTIFGRWIGRFLKGEFGGVEDINPYLLMFPYAADRWQAKNEIENWLNEGRVIISNRYTGSTAYQAAKLPPRDRRRFTDWSFQMEYQAFGIPREDLVIFLYVPIKVSQKLIETKKKRKYLGRKIQKDIHESNIKLLTEVEKVYLSYIKRFPHWVKIDCVKNGQILSRDEIQHQIIDVLLKKKIIKI